MNNRTEAKLTDLSGMQKAIEGILKQAWERGRKYGQNEERPQGDLISREALKKALKSNCKPELCHDYNTAWCERCCRTNDFEDLIDNAPTVVAENAITEPTGEWIKKVDDVGFVSYVCSSCGFELELEDCSDSYYCTNCGAKMKGGEGE